jgi:antitoxin component YwqK of YwqJK toxin-antitoxin module
MKRFSWLLIAVLMGISFFACGNGGHSETVESADDSVSRTTQKINSTKNGLIREYYDDGALKSETEYRNGIKEGRSISYYSSGQIQSTATYKNDRLYGEMIRYFRNGQKSSLSNFNLKGIAPMKIWYENGQIRQEGNIVDDKMDGRWVEYFESGNISSIKFYKMNTKDGLWLYFSTNGDTVRRELYKNDLLVETK